MLALKNCGGRGGQKTYTAPDGTTVKSSKAVYTNNGYYYLANLFDGSVATPTIAHVEGIMRRTVTRYSTLGT